MAPGDEDLGGQLGHCQLWSGHTGDKVMQGWGHCPGVAANSKITGWVWSSHQKMLENTWGGQGHQWHQEVSVPWGDKEDRMMENLLMFPDQIAP